MIKSRFFQQQKITFLHHQRSSNLFFSINLLQIKTRSKLSRIPKPLLQVLPRLLTSNKPIRNQTPHRCGIFITLMTHNLFTIINIIPDFLTSSRVQAKTIILTPTLFHSSDDLKQWILVLVSLASFSATSVLEPVWKASEFGTAVSVEKGSHPGCVVVEFFLVFRGVFVEGEHQWSDSDVVEKLLITFIKLREHSC